MTRGRIAVLAVVLLGSLGAGGSAAASGPFYLVPSPTTECQYLKNCIAVTGPFVVVPAHGEATFLLGCPTRRGYLVGGTDSRGSSSAVRVWFDAQLGSPVGSSARNAEEGAVVLFHASSDDGKLSWFQPILGCVALVPQNKRSTLSARVGVPTAPAPDLRVLSVPVYPGPRRPIPTSPLSCVRNERLVSHWTALAFTRTGNIPNLAAASAVSTDVQVLGDTVQTEVQVTRSLPATAEVQVGAVCES